MTTHRTNGLDTLRALAILLVFVYHYKVFVSGRSTFGWASDFGWVGVDLFFVLSGYLMANQIMAAFKQQGRFHLGYFYARRAMRTWPAFWVVLAGYFLFPSLMGGREPPALWRFLTFTQNYQLQPGTAFSHAWSLCIEEQFYLVLPLLALVWHASGGHRYRAWLMLAALTGVGVIARYVLWREYGLEPSGQIQGYHPNIYYATLCRFDEFLPGVAVALLKHRHPELWQKIMQRGKALFVVALVVVCLALYGAYSQYYRNGYGYLPFMTIFGYTAIALAFAVAVMAALSPSSPLHRLRIPGAYHLAIWSYSIYLSHKAVAFILNGQLQAASAPSWLIIVLVSIACLIVGALLYRCVEVPFMSLRDKQFPSLVSPAKFAP